jgi:hypothetical protein
MSGLPYWLFSLIGAVAALLITLLTIVLALTDLRPRRSRGDRGSTGRAAAAPTGDSAVLAAPWEAPRPPANPVDARALAWLAPGDQPADDDDELIVPGAKAEYPTMLAQVHQVILGGDRVRIALADDVAPELVSELIPPSGQQRRRRYLAWAPHPYDSPAGGIAFASLGSGDRGCLFLDLGQAPSAITIGGDRTAVARLTDSIVHQLCGTSQGAKYTVMVIGDALRKPHPPTATWLASLDRLKSALTAYPSQLTAIVFCELGTAADAQALTDRVAGARCRIVPVVLNGSATGPWSITTTPTATR